MVVLVGLPGAGKSTFAEALAKSDAAWVRVSQDEVGSRQGVEEMVGRLGRDHGARIVLDRCNVEPADRKYFVDLAMVSKGERVVCVYFAAASAEECTQRISQRTDHPTIPYGGGKRAVQGMLKVLKAPTASETFFDEIITIHSHEEGNQLLHKWGASLSADDVAETGLFKFPRTHHVVNTGGSAVTRDDLVMTGGDLGRFVGSGHVVIAEEKVDGSNLGFSLSKDYEVKAQNRSHWVCANSHSQFKGLEKWLEEHSWALCQLLVPEEEVLFGEWCYARHSVPYTRLPGYFIAFDIYNKRSGRFASVEGRNRRLEGLEIPIVPTLARQVFHSKDQLLALLESRSAYHDGFVEGAYLRVDEVVDESGGGGGGGGGGAALHNAFRGKIVRPDFIQGIKEHWQSRTVERNGLGF